MTIAPRVMESTSVVLWRQMGFSSESCELKTVMISETLAGFDQQALCRVRVSRRISEFESGLGSWVEGVELPEGDRARRSSLTRG